MTHFLVNAASVTAFVALVGANNSPRGSKSEIAWCCLGWFSVVVMLCTMAFCLWEMIQGTLV